MAGTILDRKLSVTRSTRTRFDLATREDDAGIRRLLRENPMAGSISLSLEREPDYFADDALPGEEKQTIVAREAERIVCMGSCTTRPRFVNGEKCRVGYLSGLRLDSNLAGRSDIVRRGYEFFRELQSSAPADYYFTSIAADNQRARNYLERGLPGMPAYEWIGDYVTVLLPVRQRKENACKLSCGDVNAAFMEELCGFLNTESRNHHLAPCWSMEDLPALQPLGLGMENFRILRENGGVIACAALWDQRCFKQTVIRSYAPWLARMRPVINLAAHITRIPRLPAIGSTLAHAFVSHFAIADKRPQILYGCIDAMLEAAEYAKLEFITLGLAANDPRIAGIDRAYRSRKYQSRLYMVHWPGTGGSACGLDSRSLGPEVALL